ncbi:MAG: ion transporter [Lachnospiraceae bacterium]|nr:ion transporter [Lachnospiraceae bacterium]
MNAKKRIFSIIQIGSRSDVPSYAFDIGIVIVILVNIFVTFFSTFDQAKGYESILDAAELVTVIIFAVEYILRVWTSQYLYPDKSQAKAALSFALSAPGLIDLFSFLPYFLPVFFPAGAVAFRMFRVIRIFKLFRVNAQYDAFNVIVDVIKEKKNQLISSMCIVMIFMLATSMCMYSVEHEAQPEQFQNAFSGLWWSASTLLTIGYGDVYPITTVGKMLAILISFLGVGLVAIPTGIISAAFVDRYSHLKEGGTIDDKAINFVTPTLSTDHPWVGMKVGEVILPPSMEIINIFRNGKAIDPKDNSRLKENDELVIFLRR